MIPLLSILGIFLLLVGCASMLTDDQRESVARTVDSHGETQFRSDRWSMCGAQVSGTILQIESENPSLYEDWKTFCKDYWQ